MYFAKFAAPINFSVGRLFFCFFHIYCPSERQFINIYLNFYYHKTYFPVMYIL